MARRPAERAIEDPREALGRWMAQRQSAKIQYREILNQRGNKLDAVNGAYGPKSHRVQNARKDLDEAELQQKEIYGVLHRPLNRFHFHWRNFVVFAAVLAVLEGSVNKFLFDVALQSYGFVSYATSFVIAFCMVLLAHLAGRSLRQVWSEYRRRILWSSIGVFVIIIGALAAIVSILTVGRAMTTANAGLAGFDEIFGAMKTSVVELGLLATLRAAFGNLNALALATVNIAGIFAAMMLAYFTHDPDRDYDLAATKVERHRRELDRYNERYVAARDQVIARFAPRLTATSARFKAANSEVIQLRHILDQPSDPDDDFMIDDWDDFAETSAFTEGKPNAIIPTEDGKVSRLPKAKTEAPDARRA
jgi:hypothetical protein